MPPPTIQLSPWPPLLALAMSLKNIQLVKYSNHLNTKQLNRGQHELSGIQTVKSRDLAHHSNTTRHFGPYKTRFFLVQFSDIQLNTGPFENRILNGRKEVEMQMVLISSGI